MSIGVRQPRGALSGQYLWPKLDGMAELQVTAHDSGAQDLTLSQLNVADRLASVARAMPDALAVVCPRSRSRRAGRIVRGPSGATYSKTSFSELDADATRLARGLLEWGVRPGMRLALLVRPGIEFVALVFALLRAGVTMVLIDPGLGRRNVVRCLAETKPDGFVAIGVAQAARAVLRSTFPRAHWNVTIGRRWFWGGTTYNRLLRRGEAAEHTQLPECEGDNPAAIIFTSGSTGPPKGVLYTHRMFDTQVAEIQNAYGIKSGGVDLSCFPLFALFNSAMGVTTVFPDMDFARPASADPTKLLAVANDWSVTQAFASPALWRRLSEHCGRAGQRIESLTQVFSCGAPVPVDVLRATLACVGSGGQMHTPYGATECLPVATIEATEILGETAARTNAGAGVCVGRKFDSIHWRVIRITDEPIATIDDAEQLPAGEIGELIVRGPQASPRYVTRTECNDAAKIVDGGVVWHRMGDVGYFDDTGRFWYCGRKSQRVETRHGTLFTERIEAVFNRLPGVRRAALVGVGSNAPRQPVMIIEPNDPSLALKTTAAKQRQCALVASWCDVEPKLESLWFATHGSGPLHGIVFHREFPVDVRHNSKINREQLAEWAAKQLPELR